MIMHTDEGLLHSLDKSSTTMLSAFGQVGPSATISVQTPVDSIMWHVRISGTLGHPCLALHSGEGSG